MANEQQDWVAPMRPPRVFAIMVLSLVLCATACHSSAREAPALWGMLQPGSYAVGFRRVVLEDDSRAVPVPGAAGSGSHRSRPIVLYLWYPARGSAHPEESFETYVRMAGADARWPDLPAPAPDSAVFEGLPLRRGLSEDAWSSLLATAIAVEEGAAPAKGRFPLVLLGQGLYYESPITHAVLCEYLASHGYVVATSPLFGRYSPWVRLDLGDLEAQVRDMEFLLSHARSLAFVQDARTAVVGFDMGGMSSVILAMRNPGTSAMVSIESGILFPHLSGLPFTAPDYDPDHFRIPWLHVTARNRLPRMPKADDGETLFGRKRFGTSFLLLLPDGQHMEFTSYALYGIQQPVRNYWAAPTPTAPDRYRAVVRLVRRFLDTYLTEEGDPRVFPPSDLESAFSGLGLEIVERSGMPPGPDFDVFVSRAGALGIPAALAWLEREGSRSSSSGAPFPELRVNQYGYRLLYFEGDVNGAIQIFLLNTRLHPESANVWDSLGEAYYYAGDSQAAITCYRRALELDPESANARAMLEVINESLKHPG